MITTSLQPVVRNERYVCFSEINALCATVRDNQLVMRGRKFSIQKLSRILAVLAARRLQTSPTTDFARRVDDVLLGRQGTIPAIINHTLAHLPPGGTDKLNQVPFQVIVNPRDLTILTNFVNQGVFTDDLEDLKTFAVANSIILVSYECVPYKPISIGLQISERVGASQTIPEFLLPHRDHDDDVDLPLFTTPLSPASCLNLGIAFRDNKAQFISASTDPNPATHSQALSLMLPIYEVVALLSAPSAVSNFALQLQSKIAFRPEDGVDYTNIVITCINSLYQFITPVAVTTTPAVNRGMALQNREVLPDVAAGANPRAIADSLAQRAYVDREPERSPLNDYNRRSGSNRQGRDNNQQPDTSSQRNDPGSQRGNSNRNGDNRRRNSGRTFAVNPGASNARIGGRTRSNVDRY